MASMHYMSPEVAGVWNGACYQGLLPEPDMLAYDIWALGCVMVFVLTGEIAFDFDWATDYSDVSVIEARVNIQHKLWVSFLPLASYILIH